MLFFGSTRSRDRPEGTCPFQKANVRVDKMGSLDGLGETPSEDSVKNKARDAQGEFPK
jgi:hypothetical protein